MRFFPGKGKSLKFPYVGKQSTNYAYTPHEVINVRKGSKYRLRIIGNGVLNAPIAISIDKHQMTLIASDGAPFEPVTVDYFTVFSGERYDFIVDASQEIGNYWIRMKCLEVPGKPHQTAILRYSGAKEVEPEEPSGFDDMKTTGKVKLLLLIVLLVVVLVVVFLPLSIVVLVSVLLLVVVEVVLVVVLVVVSLNTNKFSN